MKRDLMNGVPDQALHHSVVGIDARSGTFGERLGTEPVLVVFLRHLG